MAFARHVGFSKLDIFIAKLLYACDSASSLQISFRISKFLSRFRRLGQNLRQCTKFRQIRTIRG